MGEVQGGGRGDGQIYCAHCGSWHCNVVLVSKVAATPAPSPGILLDELPKGWQIYA